jgi:DNA-directed RNA polymerase specialized sigma24 family protein
MTTCSSPAQLASCLPIIRQAITPMCRASAKRLRCDPEEIVSEVVEQIFLRVSAGGRIVNLVRYSRRYARCHVKRVSTQQAQVATIQECAWADDPLKPLIAQEERRLVREEVERLPSADRMIVIAILRGDREQLERIGPARRIQALGLLRERLGKRGLDG